MTAPSEDLKATIDDLQETIIELQVRLSHQKTALKSERNLREKFDNTLIHHLKNAVGNANTFSEMLLNSDASFTPEKMQKYLNVVHKSTGFSIALLSNYAKYLDSLKPISDEELETFCVHDLLDHRIDQLKSGERVLRPAKSGNNTTLILSNHADIQEVIDQLLSNALRLSLIHI